MLGVVKDVTGGYSAGLLGCGALFLAGTVALLELGARWQVEWPREVVERSGVYAYRGLRPAVDDRLA